MAERARLPLWLAAHTDAALKDFQARAARSARLSAEQETELPARIRAGRRGGGALKAAAR